MQTGAHPPLIGFADIRALPDAQAAEVFAAYTAMFRQVRALLAGPCTAGLQRDDLNARAHLLLSAAHWLRAWIHRHAVDDYPRVAQRHAQLLLHGLAAAGQHWPADAALASLGLDAVAAAALQAGGPAPLPDDSQMAEAFLRAATQLVNEQGYRGASVDTHLGTAEPDQGRVLPPPRHQARPDQRLLRAQLCGAARHPAARPALAPAPAWLRACAGTAALVRFQLGPLGPLLRSTATSALPDDAQRALVRRQLQQLTEHIAGLLVDGLEDGSLRPHDPAIAAQLLASAINAAAELQRWVPGVQADNAVALYARPALLGLLCPI